MACVDQRDSSKSTSSGPPRSSPRTPASTTSHNKITITNELLNVMTGRNNTKSVVIHKPINCSYANCGGHDRKSLVLRRSYIGPWQAYAVAAYPRLTKDLVSGWVTHDGGSEKWKTSEANDTRAQEGTLTSRQATTEYNHQRPMTSPCHHDPSVFYTPTVPGTGESVTAVTRGAATVGQAPMLIKFSKPFKLIGILSGADASALSHTPVQEVTM
ncbi:hypothetical protein BU15DRAFT_67952 [Melanogaster broomeanus]|nr:hypothetical protein BU15DRAFT_67952 [Melanogaster broomeanus]